jgi:hypothetical protein
MSSNAYAPPLHVVPDVQTTKARWLRFGVRQALRRRAYLAYYKALSLARSAVGWALRQIHRGVEVTGNVGVFSWLSGQARNVVGLIREAGIVPSVLAVLSAPPITVAAVRAARSVGNGVLRMASAAWTGLKGLLGRCGSTGTQIVESLSRTGTHVADAAGSVAKHPMMTPVVHALRATLALVRPVSQGFVAHRLLRALVPILWLRIAFELLIAPLLFDSTLVGNVRDWATTPSTESDSASTDDTQADLLIDSFGPATDVPMPTNGDLPGDCTAQADVAEQADEGLFLNRAERRAQQRQDAQTKRAQHPRR